MKGVNKVILVGTLGRDPETKSFPNGGSVCNFSVATSETWVDKSTGERKEHTEWHRITANAKLAENAQKYLRKGSKVYLEGSLKTRQWKDQNGQDKFATEIKLSSMQMLDSKPQQQQSNGYAQQPQQAPQQQQQGYGYTQNQNQDEDLPF